MFQGLDINSTFRLQLRDLDDCAYDSFWKLKNTKEEYYKTVRTGEGRIPRSMFMDQETHNLEMKPFMGKGFNNREVAERLSDIAEKQGLHIYIKDYSYLGFQAMSIYVPGLSEIIDYDFGITELQDTFESIRQMLRETRLDIGQLNALLVRVVSENLISAEYTVAELLGLSLNQNYQGILKCNIYLFIAWLNVLLRRQGDCEEWMNKYHTIMKINKREARIETAIFQALIAGVPQDIFMGYLENVVTEKEKGVTIKKVNYYYQLQKEGICLDVCNECNQCQLRPYCNYSVVAQLKRNLNEKNLKYEQEYDYTDEFYQ